MSQLIKKMYVQIHKIADTFIIEIKDHPAICNMVESVHHEVNKSITEMQATQSHLYMGSKIVKLQEQKVRVIAVVGERREWKGVDKGDQLQVKGD